MPKLQIQLLIEPLPGEPNEPLRFFHEENFETEDERIELLQAIHVMCVHYGVWNPFAELGDKGTRLLEAADTARGSRWSSTPERPDTYPAHWRRSATPHRP